MGSTPGPRLTVSNEPRLRKASIMSKSITRTVQLTKRVACEVKFRPNRRQHTVTASSKVFPGRHVVISRREDGMFEAVSHKYAAQAGTPQKAFARWVRAVRGLINQHA